MPNHLNMCKPLLSGSDFDVHANRYLRRWKVDDMLAPHIVYGQEKFPLCLFCDFFLLVLLSIIRPHVGGASGAYASFVSHSLSTNLRYGTMLLRLIVFITVLYSA